MNNHYVIPADPGLRFGAIYEALEEHRGYFGDPIALRFAAVTATTIPGSPYDIATAIRRVAEEIKTEIGWFNSLRSSLRFIVSAMLVQNEDSVSDFLGEVERVGKLFRQFDLRSGGIYETMAILILRIRRNLEPITEHDVVRFKALYEEMKRHHWWLTGPDDYPACATLVHQEGAPEHIGQRIEDIYQGLHERGFTRGDPLQTAANILALVDRPASATADRFKALADTFKTTGQRIWQSNYDELAILSFLDHDPAALVEKILRHADGIATLRPKPHGYLAFNIAASLGFLDLVGVDRKMSPITEPHALMSLHAMMVHQAVASATAAATVAVAATAG